MAFTFLVFGLPIFSKELGATALEIGGLYSIITATVLLGRPLVGWLIDHYGRKPFLLAPTEQRGQMAGGVNQASAQGGIIGVVGGFFIMVLVDKAKLHITNISTLAWAFFPAGIAYSLLPARLGKLSDRFGRAPMMAIGLVGAGILSLLLPNLTSLVWLVVLYTLTAVGWSMADPAEAAIVADLTGKETRGRDYGLYELAVNLGASIGPLLGGWVYDSLGKGVPFYVNGVTLFLGAVWILVFFRQWRRGVE
jgi:MFS family permease